MSCSVMTYEQNMLNMLYNMFNVRLYNTCHVILSNMCHVMLYNIYHVMLFDISWVIYITSVMLYNMPCYVIQYVL